jgi:hypothetical protein
MDLKLDPTSDGRRLKIQVAVLKREPMTRLASMHAEISDLLAGENHPNQVHSSDDMRLDSQQLRPSMLSGNAPLGAELPKRHILKVIFPSIRDNAVTERARISPVKMHPSTPASFQTLNSSQSDRGQPSCILLP